jgi:hypothetical protein
VRGLVASEGAGSGLPIDIQYHDKARIVGLGHRKEKPRFLPPLTIGEKRG